MSKKRKSSKKFGAPTSQTSSPAPNGLNPTQSLASDQVTDNYSSVLVKWAPLIIVLLGVITFLTGMTGQFMADDTAQITDNPIIHSFSNIEHFFTGSTYFNGAELVGNYYRPIMTTIFSALYSLFGTNPVPFHLVQLSLYLLAAVLLFSFLRYSFALPLALGLTLIFLVHPINSQAVYSISALQDVLFFLFGMLAMWILLRFDSTKSMMLAVACIFLSLLSKETGILFVFMALTYLYLFDRKRIWRFVQLLAAPLILYILLKLNAVGLGTSPTEAPIDHLGLWSRLATAPSILLFYLQTFVWPTHLASRYFWTYPDVSVGHFWLPLMIDLAIVVVILYGAKIIRRHLPHGDYLTFWFYAAWAAVGFAIHMQVVPLDMTACTNWFIFPMVGILGMLGEVIKALSRQRPISRSWSLSILAIVVVLLGTVSSIRGFDWKNQEVLAARDVAVSSNGNAAGYVNLADQSYKKGDYKQTKAYAQASISVSPGYAAYNDLGYADLKLGDYPAALDAFQKGLKFYKHENIYVGIAEATTLYGDYQTNLQLLSEGLKNFPKNPTIRMARVILEIHNHDHPAAMAALAEAAKFNPIDPAISNAIENQQPFNVDYGPAPQAIQ